jgi:hypothetical protein
MRAATLANNEEETKMSKNNEIPAADAIVTRFDTFEREEGEVVRLFAKRKLITELDLEDVIEVKGEDWDAQLEQQLGAAGKPIGEVLDFLSDEVNEESDDEEEEGRGSIVPLKYRIRYGSPQNCGDEIALALTAFVTLPRANKKDSDGGLDRARLRAVAEVNGIGDKLAGWEDRGLNGGLLRMNTSNVLRGMNRRGEAVKIGELEWPADPAKLEERKARRRKPAKAKPEAAA